MDQFLIQNVLLTLELTLPKQMAHLEHSKVLDACILRCVRWRIQVKELFSLTTLFVSHA